MVIRQAEVRRIVLDGSGVYGYGALHPRSTMDPVVIGRNPTTHPSTLPSPRRQPQRYVLIRKRRNDQPDKAYRCQVPLHPRASTRRVISTEVDSYDGDGRRHPDETAGVDVTQEALSSDGACRLAADEGGVLAGVDRFWSSAAVMGT